MENVSNLDVGNIFTARYHLEIESEPGKELSCDSYDIRRLNRCL